MYVCCIIQTRRQLIGIFIVVLIVLILLGSMKINNLMVNFFEERIMSPVHAL